MDYSILISTPMRTIKTEFGTRLPMVTAEWARARQNLIYPTGHRVGQVICDGLPIDEARCKVSDAARKTGAKYLFFLDRDVLPPEVTLARLTYLLDNNPGWGMVSAMYTTRELPPAPLMWTKWDEGVQWNFTVSDLVKCVGVPTGCLLIRLAIFDDLPADEKPWFKELVNAYSDDLFFCHRVTEETGWEIYCDTALQCGHIDDDTGIVFGLPQDSLPWKRWHERHAMTTEATADA